MTKRVTITNADSGPYGVRINHSSGAVFDLPNAGDQVQVYVSASQSFAVTEYDVVNGKTVTDSAPPPAAKLTPVTAALFQNDDTRQYMPGAWLYSTTQLMRKDHGLTDDQVRRIMLNCGCLENGVWWDENGDPFPAAFRGFEQADSKTEEERLHRRNATAFVKDIEQVTSRNGTKRWELSKVSLGTVLGLLGETRPLIYAVRARDEAELATWIRESAFQPGDR